jgi:hypothetical protein
MPSDSLTDGIPRMIDDEDLDNTRRHDPSPRRRSQHRTQEDIDDDWGPPGTTIPPPFLGAMPGTDTAAPGAIPLSTDDEESAPLLMAPPSPPEASAPVVAPIVTKSGRTMLPPSRPIISAPSPALLARDLEDASTRLVDLLRHLDQAQSRDAVIQALVAHIAETHDRVAFLAVKGGELAPFHQRPPARGPTPLLRLDAPSTLQDVVGTRLPYRGPISDDATRAFLKQMFGDVPGEMLALPVAVRERVVGVLYGDGRNRHTFDEHFAVAGRAAGLALERILKAKRGA